MYFLLTIKTPLFRTHVLRTRRLVHTPSLSWLQNLNFKLGAVRQEEGLGLLNRKQVFKQRNAMKRDENSLSFLCYNMNISFYPDARMHF